MSKIKLKIVTPDKLLLEEEVTQIVLPGSEGEFTLLAAHIPFLSTLGSGFIKIHQGEKLTESIYISGGLSQVENDVCTVLVEKVIDLKSQDKKSIEAEIKEVEAKIKEAANENNDKKCHKLEQQISDLEKIKSVL